MGCPAGTVPALLGFDSQVTMFCKCPSIFSFCPQDSKSWLEAFSLLNLGHVWPPSAFIIWSNVLFLFFFDQDSWESLQIQRLFWLLVSKADTQNPTTFLLLEKRNHIHIKNYISEVERNWNGIYLNLYPFKGVQPAAYRPHTAQDGCECGTTQNREFT